MRKYKVRYYGQDCYEVCKYNEEEQAHNESVFIGTLPECESWIRLTEEGYMD